MYRFILLNLVLFFIYGCADRQHDNPLDPLNEKTEGRPVGLDVLSFERNAVLSWQPFQVDGLIGIKVYRQIEDDSMFQEIGLVTDQSVFEDSNVDFGLTYHYRIQAITEDYQSPFSESVSITPGPSYVWVTSGSFGIVSKLTHDASHLIFQRSSFLYPFGIAGAGYKNGVWITDFFLDQAVRITERGTIIKYISGLTSPLDIAYNPFQNYIWIADRDNGKVFMLDSLETMPSRAANFNSPVSVSVDRSSGKCWVADPGNRSVGLIDPGSFYVERYGNFVRPEEVDVTYSNGSCWIADSSQVVKLDRNGNRLISIQDFIWASRVAANDRTGECWVIDWGLQYNEAKIIKISTTGTKLFEVDGFSNPESIDVDPFDGSCLVADTWNNRIVKLSPQGEKIGEFRSPSPMIVKVVTQ
jgi:DNA-binding beta-propeller fold protein YncE